MHGAEDQKRCNDLEDTSFHDEEICVAAAKSVVMVPGRIEAMFSDATNGDELFLLHGPGKNSSATNLVSGGRIEVGTQKVPVGTIYYRTCTDLVDVSDPSSTTTRQSDRQGVTEG